MSSYTKATHIIYLDLPSSVANKIDKVRKAARSPGAQRWRAHITLKAEEDYYTDQLDDLQERVRDFSLTLSPLSLQIGAPKMHIEKDGISWNIYLPVRPSKILHSVTKTLSRCLESLIDPAAPGAFKGSKWEQSDAYYAHVSLISGKGVAEGRQILRNIKGMKLHLPKTVTCTSTTLAQWNQVRWKKITSHKLSIHI